MIGQMMVVVKKEHLLKITKMHKNSESCPQQYKKAKNKAGDAFYATVVHGTLKDREDAMHRMAEDVNKQQESPGPARRHTSR